MKLFFQFDSCFAYARVELRRQNKKEKKQQTEKHAKRLE